MTIRITRKPSNSILVEKIREISGENPTICMQCGTCSAVCPTNDATGMTPRVAMQLAMLGLEEELARKTKPETCAACQACMVRCPRGLDVTKVMEALRLIALRDNINLITPEDIPAEDIQEMPAMALVAAFRKLTA